MKQVTPNHGKPRKDGTPKIDRCDSRKEIVRGEIKQMALANKPRNYIINVIVEKYGYSEATVEEYTREVLREIKAEFKDYAKKVADKNYKLLQAIINDSYDIKKYGITLDAIKEQNKMANLYDNSIKLTTDEPFIIKLGN